MPILLIIGSRNDSMRLPTTIYNVIPVVYFVMGVATGYFSIEAVLLERSLGLALILAVAAIAQIAYGLHIRHLRGNNKENGASVRMQPAE